MDAFSWYKKSRPGTSAIWWNSRIAIRMFFQWHDHYNCRRKSITNVIALWTVRKKNNKKLDGHCPQTIGVRQALKKLMGCWTEFRPVLKLRESRIQDEWPKERNQSSPVLAIWWTGNLKTGASGCVIAWKTAIIEKNSKIPAFQSILPKINMQLALLLVSLFSPTYWYCACGLKHG